MLKVQFKACSPCFQGLLSQERIYVMYYSPIWTTCNKRKILFVSLISQIILQDKVSPTKEKSAQRKSIRPIKKTINKKKLRIIWHIKRNKFDLQSKKKKSKCKGQEGKEKRLAKEGMPKLDLILSTRVRIQGFWVNCRAENCRLKLQI